MNASNRHFALVTGASSGIGLELAKEFARNAFDLLIVSNSDRIQEAEQTLRAFGTNVISLKADLATYGGVEQFCSEIKRHPIDAAAINAGVGVWGDFARTTELDAELNLIQLNVVSPVHITKCVVKEMLSRGGGRILYTSSVAGTMPAPFEAVYGASKAFLTSFAQAVRNELKDSNISITVLMPGATETNFFHRAGMEGTKLGASAKDNPAEVAREGFAAMMAGKDHVVAGSFKNKIQAAAGHALPDAMVAGMHRKQSEPGSAQR